MANKIAYGGPHVVVAVNEFIAIVNPPIVTTVSKTPRRARILLDQTGLQAFW